MKRIVTGMCLGMLTTVLHADPAITPDGAGYFQQTFERGKLYMPAFSFTGDTGKVYRANDVFGDQVPIGTFVARYDGITPYITDSRSVTGWTTNIAFNSFDGFWLKLPTLGNPPAFQVFFTGLVSVEDTECFVLNPGLNMIAYPYATDIAFTNTQLCAGAKNGDQIHIWNPATSNYVSCSKTVVGWGTCSRNFVLRMGVGFWYKHNWYEPRTVCETRPYPVF